MPRTRNKNGLTDKQQQFVKEYLVDFNGVQAAYRAGYKHVDQAAQLVRKTHIQEAIRKEKEALAKRTELTQDRWAKEVARLSYVDPRRLYNEDGTLKPVHELDDDIAACISSVEVVTTYKKDEEGNMVPERTTKIKFWDKNSALDKGGRFLKLFADTVNLGVDKETMANATESARQLIHGAIARALACGGTRSPSGEPDE